MFKKSNLVWLAVEWSLEEQMHHWDVLWDYGALTALTDCLYRYGTSTGTNSDLKALSKCYGSDGFL